MALSIELLSQTPPAPSIDVPHPVETHTTQAPPWAQNRDCNHRLWCCSRKVGLVLPCSYLTQFQPWLWQAARLRPGSVREAFGTCAASAPARVVQAREGCEGTNPARGRPEEGPAPQDKKKPIQQTRAVHMNTCRRRASAPSVRKPGWWPASRHLRLTELGLTPDPRHNTRKGLTADDLVHSIQKLVEPGGFASEASGAARPGPPTPSSSPFH